MTQSLVSDSELVSEPVQWPPAQDTAPETAAGPPASGAGGESGSGPAALADLVTAGLVSHEMIGDPARLGGETATLRVLCRHVPGSIWRIEPYHYAFRLDAGAEDPEAAGLALEAALAADLGPDAAWVSATDLIAGDPSERMEAGSGPGSGAPMEEADLDAPLLLLRASAEAVADGLVFAGPGVQAVVSAGFAVRAARIAAAQVAADRAEAAGSGAEAGLEAEPGLALRFAAIEAGQARIEAALAADAESRAAAAAAEVRLTELLAKVLCRLDAQADVLHGHIAREATVADTVMDTVAERLGEVAALAGGLGSSSAAFQETLGLALAEFLARLERREAAPARVPQAR